jgi:L-threonylcarbamoyladenylate synthase
MEKKIKITNQYLLSNKTILYPTDTVYGLGCDATNETAVAKIYKIKNREESKSLIVLVNSMEMLQNYVTEIPQKIKDFLNQTNKPTTVIYNNPKNLAKNVIANDNTVAIRIVKNGFVNVLLNQFKKPIVSTSANISNEPTPKDFKSISKKIKENVDFIVSLPSENKNSKPSQIIRLINDEIVFLRK